jgi:hypothetical protein
MEHSNDRSLKAQTVSARVRYFGADAPLRGIRENGSVYVLFGGDAYFPSLRFAVSTELLPKRAASFSPRGLLRYPRTNMSIEEVQKRLDEERGHLESVAAELTGLIHKDSPGTTPPVSSRLTVYQHYKIFRDYANHEDGLINNRLLT